MTQFSIDGEPLAFSGREPASLDELVSLVAPALGGQGRVLAEVRIDGAAVADPAGASGWSAAKTIDVFSIPIAEAIARIALDCEQRLAAIVPEAERIACEVLRRPWGEVAGACADLAGSIGETVRDAGGMIENVPELQPAATALADAVHGWIAAIEARDSGLVCIGLDRSVLPALATLLDCIRRARGSA